MKMHNSMEKEEKEEREEGKEKEEKEKEESREEAIACCVFQSRHFNDKGQVKGRHSAPVLGFSRRFFQDPFRIPSGLFQDSWRIFFFQDSFGTIPGFFEDFIEISSGFASGFLQDLLQDFFRISSGFSSGFIKDCSKIL